MRAAIKGRKYRVGLSFRGEVMFCQGLGASADTLIALVSCTTLYFWGLLLAGHPPRESTSGSYPPSRSMQCRAATRNSCAKLASISLTFSLTVNPFLLSFSRCFFSFNGLVSPLFLFLSLSFFFLLQVPVLSEVIDRGTQCWIGNRQCDRKLIGLTNRGALQILSVMRDR